MKIAIATAVYYPMINGVAVFARNLAVGLARRGHEVMVICPSQTGRAYTEMMGGVKTVYLKSIEVKTYPDQIHAVPEKKQVFYKHGFKVSVFPGKEVRAILDDFHPDVVHVQVSDPIGLSVVSYARKHKIPVVTTEHNQPEVLTEPLHLPGVVRKPVNALLSAYFANRQSKSDFVTMPTKQAIYHLLDGRKGFNVPVAAVSNGVDLSSFKPGRARNEIYQKYDLPSGVPIVLYVGRVDPEKKVGLVFEAFIEMLERSRGDEIINNNKLDKLSRTCLVVVGDGVDKVRLEVKAKQTQYASQVKFLGRVVGDDLNEIYRCGTVFVTASEIETQGIVLIEAAASGLPLVAVNKGAVSEICVNEVNGFLCGPGNVDEMSKAMEKIITDEKMRIKFSAASVKLAEEHDFERTLDKFENIYKRVARKR